jgi:pantoate--beta-alanine ligase
MILPNHFFTNGLKNRPFRRFLHIVRTGTEMRDVRWKVGTSSRVKKRADTVGFVATMGALHEGHLDLVRASKTECSLTYASIFINPAQFSPGEDLEKYPASTKFESDVNKFREEGVSLVFAPSAAEMFPILKQKSTGVGNAGAVMGAGEMPGLCHIEPEAFKYIAEGKARPQFFRGVATIVAKLLNVVQPDVAYFGQKDVAQAIMIRCMIRDLLMPVRVRVVETTREFDGLALSSRNAYLTPEERKHAPVLFEALECARQLAEKVSHRSDSPHVCTALAAKECALQVLLDCPLVGQVEYISIADPESMLELSDETPLRAEAGGAVISAAIRVGNVRLIDNVLALGADRHILC